MIDWIAALFFFLAAINFFAGGLLLGVELEAYGPKMFNVFKVLINILVGVWMLYIGIGRIGG